MAACCSTRSASSAIHNAVATILGHELGLADDISLTVLVHARGLSACREQLANLNVRQLQQLQRNSATLTAAEFTAEMAQIAFIKPPPKTTPTDTQRALELAAVPYWTPSIAACLYTWLRAFPASVRADLARTQLVLVTALCTATNTTVAEFADAPPIAPSYNGLLGTIAGMKDLPVPAPYMHTHVCLPLDVGLLVLTAALAPDAQLAPDVPRVTGTFTPADVAGILTSVIRFALPDVFDAPPV